MRCVISVISPSPTFHKPTDQHAVFVLYISVITWLEDRDPLFVPLSFRFWDTEARFTTYSTTVRQKYRVPLATASRDGWPEFVSA